MGLSHDFLIILLVIITVLFVLLLISFRLIITLKKRKPENELKYEEMHNEVEMPNQGEENEQDQ